LPQCIKLHNKGNKILGLLKKISYSSLRILWYHCINPWCVLAYSRILHGCLVPTLPKRQRFVRESAAMIYENDPGFEKDGIQYSKHSKTLKLWSLDDRRKRGDLIDVYKMS